MVYLYAMKTKAALLACILFLICLACVACDSYVLSFEQETYYVEKGETIEPGVKIRPRGNGYVLSVENDTVASVEEDGKSLKGLRSGTMTKIYVTSGDKRAEAILIVSDVGGNEKTDYSILKQYEVTFRMSNYQDVGLEEEIFKVASYYEGDTIGEPLPTHRGYSVDGWYKDKACLEKWNRNETVNGNLDLFCKATELNNPFTFNGYGEVSGLMFMNLPHSVLEFPEETPQGQKVTGIADGAFAEDTILTSVTIPATYTRIGDFAFAGCENLKRVKIKTGSVLSSVGKFAFGYAEVTEAEDEEKEPTVKAGDVACEKLEEIDLPDSVEEIGAFAFYGCKSLILNGIPKSLKEIEYGAFGLTKIKEADFSSVTDIGAYAFYRCTDLNKVTGTQNVRSCEKAAFLECGIYNKTIGKSPYVVYIGSILYKCHNQNGKLSIGKVTLDSGTTLIADGAFNGDDQTEMTVYFGKEGVKIGDEAFRDSVGVCLVVPENAIDEYKANNPFYKDRFCTAVTVTVEEKGAVNFGVHTLLKFDENTYFYERYERIKVGDYYKSAETIDLSVLPYGDKIRRINTRAVNLEEKNVISSLKVFKMPTYVTQIAYMSILNCNSLTKIDLTSVQGIPTVEKNSIQFTTVGKFDLVNGTETENCLVYVNREDKEAYLTAWAESGVIVRRVTYPGEFGNV
ncbi:MAG: leucine-rich repeat protein [Clostridia bacterium]|nr:leucine-rich repeat protein [Clostridia bacterium]